MFSSRVLIKLLDHGVKPLRTNCYNTYNVNQSVSRLFKSTPTNHISVRNRFGRSQPKYRSNENSSSPAAPHPGRIAVAAGAALGLGGLWIYGRSLTTTSSSDALSAFDKAAVWPDYVRQRIKSTYTYLAGGAAIAAGSAVVLLRSPAFCRVMLGSGWFAPIGMMVASMGAGVVCQMLPYPASGSPSSKHLAWAIFSASIGGMLAPVCLIGGPVLAQAAIYTGGIVGALSLVATSAPSDRFLNWGGPLAMGLGVVVVSSLGSMFLSPVSRLGSGMAMISLYGGLILFSGFLLYDTQLVIHRAENHPPPHLYQDQQAFGGLVRQNQFDSRPFDPINSSIHILMDTVNIFVRIVAILSGGQRRHK